MLTMVCSGTRGARGWGDKETRGQGGVGIAGLWSGESGRALKATSAGAKYRTTHNAEQIDVGRRRSAYCSLRHWGQ